MEKQKEQTQLNIRLTVQEKEFLKSKAEDCQLTLSAYLRRCGLNKKINGSFN